MRARMVWSSIRKHMIAKCSPNAHCRPNAIQLEFGNARAGLRSRFFAVWYGACRLGDWRLEAMAVAAHADYLLRNCWKAQLTISLAAPPAMCRRVHAADEHERSRPVQLVCASDFFCRMSVSFSPPRARETTRRIDTAWNYSHERRQPYRTRRLYSAAGENSPHSTRRITNWRQVRANGRLPWSAEP